VLGSSEFISFVGFLSLSQGVWERENKRGMREWGERRMRKGKIPTPTHFSISLP
jgi:hypothetical protein